MKKEDSILAILENLFPNPSIPLDHKDPYTLLIATVLSARCTDARVNQITPILFQKANTPEQMIRLDPKEIQAIIRPCGLSEKKAFAIHQLSQDLLNDHQGKVPCTFEDLEKLPGVGHKTASVVLSQAFHIPAFPVDTHIHRCAQRWGLSQGKSRSTTEKNLKKRFPKKSWNKLHLQMIHYARAYCPARGHKKELCILCGLYDSSSDSRTT